MEKERPNQSGSTQRLKEDTQTATHPLTANRNRKTTEFSQ